MIAEVAIKLLNPAILLVLSATVLLLWRNHRAYTHLLLLGTAFLLAGIAFIANDLLTFWEGQLLRAVVNELFLTAVMLACVGALKGLKAPVPVVLLVVVTACATAMFCWFLFVQPSTNARIYVVNLACAVISAVTALTLLRAKPKNWFDWLFVCTAVLLTALAVSRPLAVYLDLLDSNQGGSLNQSGYWVSMQAFTPLVAVTIALSFLTAFGFQLFRELREAAEIDHLTSLLNRRGFDRQTTAFLTAPTAPQYHAAFMIIDIDDFHTINDHFGHSAGDQVLIKVASLLTKRGADVIGRTRGEEFALFYKDAHFGTLRGHAAAIQAEVSRTDFGLSSTDYPVTVSIGIHLRSPFETVREAMRHADEALYSAKASGKNQFRFADTEKPAGGRARL